ncbi:ABC transporter permease subunit [Actinoplanes sp. NPDC051851]|uniref:ABC transporter permease n=1 Tax=Actinoplanes sp. NPDC051851 TaxID=3154753 RepID=UPI00344003E5
MTAVPIRVALDRIANPGRVDPLLAVAGTLAWAGFAAVTRYVPDREPLAFGAFTAGAGLLVAVIWATSCLAGSARPRVKRLAAWCYGAGLWLLVWEIVTAKTQLLAPPYFAAPQQILGRMWTDRVILSESLGNSLLLLMAGFVVGLTAGLITGVVIGWFQAANYWVHPILVFLGPVPSLAWVPIIFVLFPTAYSGAVFLIAFSVWFPITVLTRAGVLGVPRSYFDVAQTLGARGWFLVLRVSLPAALPSIFTGAFMALGASFVSLTVAENFGVNSGLGWYLNWKKGWGDFPAVYAGIVVLVVVCGVLLTILFRVRNWVLRWEKELTRW